MGLAVWLGLRLGSGLGLGLGSLSLVSGFLFFVTELLKTEAPPISHYLVVCLLLIPLCFKDLCCWPNLG